MKKVLYVAVFIVTALTFLAPQGAWSQVEGIEGTWYFGDKPLTVHVYDRGWRLSATNEAGHTAHGKALNPDVIYLPSENITGRIEFEGTIIEWSNGTFWAREPFSGDEPPNLTE